MSEKCTIVVSSCDSYADVWDLLFLSIKQQWRGRTYPIVLNTESLTYDFEDMKIRTFNFYKKGQKDSWGERLKKTLKDIDSTYILFFLDDFILTKKVDEKRLEQCMKWMDENPDIATFCFYPTPEPNIADGRFKGFELRPQKALYRLNCQVALWRRDKLIQYIKDFENPWQWEINGSIRSSRYKERFYSQIKDDPKIFEYPPGGIVWRGLWTKDAPVLAKKYGVEINFEERGFMDEDNPYRLPEPYSVVKEFPRGIVTKRFWVEIGNRIENRIMLLRSLM